MKKFYLLFIVIAALNTSGFAQQSYIKAPALQTTVTSIQAPGGTSTQATFRGCYILTANDLSVIGTNTAINSIGFYLNSGTNGPAVTGTLQVYLQNTSDATYLKGASFTTAIAPMTSVYNNTYTIPATGGSVIVNLPLPTPFTYTGGGMYIGFDWITTGPFATSPAVYQAENTIANAGAAVSNTAAPASNNMVGTNTRPVINVGYINTYTNEAQVYGIYGNGRQPLINGSPYSFSVVVRNNAGVTMNNIVPTLSITGANTFVTTTTIAAIAAGGTVVATFPSYSPTSQGLNTVSVIVPPDDNNSNNTGTVAQSVTCNYQNAGPVAPIAAFNQGVGFAGGSGLLLNPIRVSSTSTLTALRLGIANYNLNAGNGIYGVITNNFGSIIATTSTVVLTGAMYSTYQIFTFPAPVTLNAGTNYYVGMAQPTAAAAYFPLATMPSPTNNMPANICATSILGGGFISVQSPTLGWFAIESVFDNGITLTVTPATSTICSGNPLVIAASGASTYSWSNNMVTGTISVTPNLYTVYTCTGSAIVGTVGACEDIKSSAVYVNLTPVITASNGAICPTPGSFTLTPTGAATYTFSGGSAVVSPTATSNYTITGTAANGCPGNTVVATVSVQPNVTVAITGPTLICNGQTATLNVTGAASYSWNTGATSGSIMVTPSTTTSYSVLGTFGSCTANAAASLSVSPALTLTAFPTPTAICAGNTGTITAFGNGSTTFSWSTGATTQSIAVSPSVTTDYTVTGVSNQVCTSSVVVTQSVVSCIGIEKHSLSSPEVSIYPNPNSGVFAISVSSITDNSVIELYSSLGQLVLKQKITDTNTNVSLNTLAKGVYIVRLKENNFAVKTARMIVQ
jgi:hypothetical protein